MSRVRGKVLSVEPANDGSFVRFADGREMGDVNIVADDDFIEELRTGHRCLICHEPQSQAFPEKCESTLPNGVRWCNFPMRRMQPQKFAEMYDKETVHVGSRVNHADELERLSQIDAYERKTGIKLPPGAGL